MVSGREPRTTERWASERGTSPMTRRVEMSAHVLASPLLGRVCPRFFEVEIKSAKGERAGGDERPPEYPVLSSTGTSSADRASLMRGLYQGEGR